MANQKLSKAQSRNLEALKEIAGGLSYTEQYVCNKAGGLRLVTSNSHKGFHIVALDSLVSKGLVKRTWKQSGNPEIWDNMDARIPGASHSTVYFYKAI